MEKNVENPSGVADDNQGPSGTTENSSGVDQSKDTVKYETYAKTVGQLKKEKESRAELEQKLAAYELKEREIEEAKLKEEGQFKELLAFKEQKIAELEENLGGLEGRILKAQKVAAFKRHLPGDLAHEDYYTFADVDKIVIDPTTNDIDSDSAKMVADMFLKEHGHLLKRVRGANPPGEDGVGGVKKTLTVAQWKALPSTAEMQKRQKDVDWNT